MFWKKKRKEETPLDRAIRDKGKEVAEAEFLLRESILDVRTAKRVVELFPEGPNKEEALSLLKTKRNIFMHTFAVYERLRNEHSELMGREGDRITTKGVYRSWHPTPMQAVFEACKEIQEEE